MWDPVPWAVDQSVMKVEALRLISYLAIDANEGVVAGADCAVMQLTVPGPAVRVMPGAVGLLNRSAEQAGAQQAYVVRMAEAETVSLTPTGSGGGRTDLVAVIVEDPQYQGQPAPASVPNGPYVRTVVYEGVPAATKTLADVDQNQTGYALALVTLPASTGAVTKAMLTDLRVIPNPRSRGETKIRNLPDSVTPNILRASSYATFPSDCTFDIDVPAWAVRVHLELYVAGVTVANDSGNDTGVWSGRARVKLGTVVTNDTELNPTVPQRNRIDTFTYLAAGDKPVPKVMRGTRQALVAQAYRAGVSDFIKVGDRFGTTTILKATFFDAPNVDYWEV